MHFSSKDFVSTKASLEGFVSGKLKHEQVLARALHAEFSNERGHGVGVVDLPSYTLSMTIGHLALGQSTRLHRHNYETLIYICEGSGFSEIANQIVEWQKGDAIYVPVWAWHRHVNHSRDSEALYVACENTPLLQNLGNIALREEAPDAART